MNGMMDLIDHYQEFFYVVRADNSELLEMAFKLRYEVFIKDCGYKLGEYDEINKTEKDCYDDQAHHCLLFHKPTHRPIGYIRLIPYKESKGNLLPIEHYEQDMFDLNLVSLKQLRSENTGELSRVSIHPLFRRRLSDQLYQVYSSASANNQRYRINYLPMCLVLACGALMYENRFDYAFVFMEKPLAKLLKSFGVVHKQIGAPIECYGIRAPYITYFQQTYDNLNPDFKALFKIIQNELITGISPVVDAQETEA